MLLVRRNLSGCVLLLQELQKVPCKQSTHALYALGLDACLYMGK